jgi:hypothetical protein
MKLRNEKSVRREYAEAVRVIDKMRNENRNDESWVEMRRRWRGCFKTTRWHL